MIGRRGEATCIDLPMVVAWAFFSTFCEVVLLLVLLLPLLLLLLLPLPLPLLPLPLLLALLLMLILLPASATAVAAAGAAAVAAHIDLLSCAHMFIHFKPSVNIFRLRLKEVLT